MIEILGLQLFASEFDGFPRRAQQAIVRALKRGGTAADTYMSRAVAADMGLKVGDVKKTFRRRQPTLEKPEFTVGAGFKRVPLMNFSARGPVPSRGKGRGVSYRMGAGNSRNRLPNAFIARMRSGHAGVFVRVSKRRLGIRELFGPSLGKVFAKYRQAATERGYEVMRSTLEHDLDRILAANAAKSAGADLVVTEVGGD